MCSADQQITNMWTFWTNHTCASFFGVDGVGGKVCVLMGIGNPTTQRAGTCTLGHLPEYVIMAKTKEHIKAGVDFARENNIRLLIRNTGHGTYTSSLCASISDVLVDFMGRSAGFGSLAINTHSFKTVTFVKNYTGPGNYTGSIPAGTEVLQTGPVAGRALCN